MITITFTFSEAEERRQMMLSQILSMQARERRKYILQLWSKLVPYIYVIFDCLNMDFFRAIFV